MNKKTLGAVGALAGMGAVGAVAFLAKKGKLVMFNKNNKCKECGKHVKGENLSYYEPQDMAYLSKDVVEHKFVEDGNVCSDCFNGVYEPNIEKYEMALDEAQNVKTYLQTYRGTVHFTEEVKKVTTECFEDRDEAIYSLKVMAAYMDCNIVYDITFEEETINDSYNKNKFYKATGILARR